MKRLFLILFLALFSALAALAQTNGKITGTIFLGNENTALHGATVKIVELNRTVVSGDDGTYVFQNVPPGHYTLVAHQEGFKDSTQTIDVAASGPAIADFKMQITGLKEEVTVTASGTEQLLSESISSVNVMDSSQITLRAAVGLGDVLNDQEGVSKRSMGAGNSRPVIRGFDGDRVKIAADGIGVGSLASQSGDHAEPVDTLAVEKIEVVKGPATLLYGSNAIGGVVNAISGHDEGAHPGFRGYFSGIGGTNGGQAAGSAGLEYGKNNWMLWGNTSAQRTGDYKAGGNFGDVINTFTRNVTAQTGFGYFGRKAFFSTNYNFYQSKYGIPFDFNDPTSPLRSLNMHRHDIKFTTGLTNLTGFIASAKFTADISRYQHQELEDGVVGTTFTNNVNSLRGMFEEKKSGSWGGRFGFETYRRNFKTVGAEVLVDGPVTQDNLSAFGLEEYTRERFTLQFGGRLERNSYNPDNPALPDRAFTGFSGAVGAKFDLWTGGIFVANFSHGYRAPALEELYNNGPHDGTLSFEVGNNALHPETTNGIDLSLRQENSRVRATANFYYYAFKNFVFLAPTGVFDPGSGLEIADYLQGNSRFTGTELSLDVTANKYLNVISGFDYVNAQLSTGQPLPRIAPARGHFGVDIHPGSFSIKPEVLMVSKQDRVFTNETPTDGYVTFNVSATYILSRKQTAHIFAVNAFNLNNKLYYNHISFIKDISPEIGRGFRATYTIRFF